MSLYDLYSHTHNPFNPWNTCFDSHKWEQSTEKDRKKNTGTDLLGFFKKKLYKIDILEFWQRIHFRITPHKYFPFLYYSTKPTISRWGLIVFFQLCDFMSNLALLFVFSWFAHVVCGLLKVGVGSGELPAAAALFKPREAAAGAAHSLLSSRRSSVRPWKRRSEAVMVRPALPARGPGAFALVPGPLAALPFLRCRRCFNVNSLFR